jgi:predicted nucleic acid-binding protein
MSDRIFVDTNILVHAHDRAAGKKAQVAVEVLKGLWETERGVLSTQVLQEFYANATRKLAKPLQLAMAREVVRTYRIWVNKLTGPETILRATGIGEGFQLSFRDAMIVAAAEESGAGTLLSEDLSDGQHVAGIQIVNPFLHPEFAPALRA